MRAVFGPDSDQLPLVHVQLASLDGYEALSIAIAVATALVLAAFSLRVAGGVYEMRTVGAMLLRAVLWAVVAAVSWRSMRR